MSLPLSRLNQLDLLRGFVAVGRCMSITRAAEELCLTQSAVSRQIRALEASLGTPLFVRGHRSIRFTLAGEQLFRSADEAMLMLQAAVARVSADRLYPVTVSASVGVAGLWLLPRLGRLQALHPQIDLRVSASNRLLDRLAGEGIDLAIRYSPPERVPAGSTWLFDEKVAPVAHPSLKLDGLDGAALAEACLLEFDHADTPWLHWESWLSSRQLSGRPRAVLRFNQYDQVIHAALAGQGVALGRVSLIAGMLADQRLVTLAPGMVPPSCRHAYWLLRAADGNPAVAAVADWIASEAVAFSHS